MKKSFLSHTLLAAAAAVALGTIAVGANADTISGTQTVLTSPTAVNLTTQGSVDWIYEYGTASGVGTFQRKANVGTIISGPVLTNNLGFNVGSPIAATWSDGHPSLTGSDTKGGFQRTNSNSTVTFTVTPDGNAQTLTVYAGVIAGTATDTYSLQNVTSNVTLTNSVASGFKWWADTINFTAAPTDILTVTLTGSNGGKVPIAGATLADAAPTPEPASLGLLGIGGAALLLISRRKRA